MRDLICARNCSAEEPSSSSNRTPKTFNNARSTSGAHPQVVSRTTTFTVIGQCRRMPSSAVLILHIQNQIEHKTDFVHTESNAAFGGFCRPFQSLGASWPLGPLARALERNGLKLASVARLKFAQRFPAKRTHTGVLRSNSGGAIQHNFIGVKKCI